MIDYKMILLPFLISVILTPLVKQYSIYCGAYAKENKRTVHHGNISRIGGVAIYLAFIITMAIFVKADRPYLKDYREILCEYRIYPW